MAQSKMMTKAIWSIVYHLVDEGIKVISRARATKGTQNITGTQYDSYGLAVFYDGKLYYSLKSSDPSKDLTRAKRSIETLADEQGGRHKGWRSIPAGYGREWANMFVQEIKNSNIIPKTGFALIVFNAAYYSGFQENAKGRYKHPFRIISQIWGDMQHIGRNFKGSEVLPYNIPSQ